MAESEQAGSVEVEKPTAAGLYDSYLGGTNHTSAEKEAAEKLHTKVPDLKLMAFANRGFHRRATRWLTEQGVRQFLDLGAGLPTEDNTHQMAERIDPDVRVLYVDYDPRTVPRARALVAGNPNIVYLEADICKPEDVLSSPELRELLNLDQPVAVMCSAVMHFVSPERDPWGIVARYMEAVPSGSYLALSHVTADKKASKHILPFYELYGGKQARETVFFRSLEEVKPFFSGLEIVAPYDGADPQVTFIGQWGAVDPVESDDDAGRWLYAGVARKR